MIRQIVPLFFTTNLTDSIRYHEEARVCDGGWLAFGASV